MTEKFTLLKTNLNPLVLIVRKFSQCPEPQQSGSSITHVINFPTTFAPDSANSLFLANATLMTKLTISRLQFNVMPPL
jgi:hypothetical protein